MKWLRGFFLLLAVAILYQAAVGFSSASQKDREVMLEQKRLHREWEDACEAQGGSVAIVPKKPGTFICFIDPSLTSVLYL